MSLSVLPIRCPKTVVNGQEDARKNSKHLPSCVLAAAESYTGGGECLTEYNHHDRPLGIKGINTD